MEKVKKKIDFTEGKVFFKILWFILPIMATNLLQMFYNAADMMVVSLSAEENAVGAIGTTGSFLHLIINSFIGFSVGANVVVAREIGAKNPEKTQNAVHTALIGLITNPSGMPSLYSPRVSKSLTVSSLHATTPSPFARG